MATASYQDCSARFVPTLEQALYTRIAETTLVELIELEEEEDKLEEAILHKDIQEKAKMGDKTGSTQNFKLLKSGPLFTLL